MVFQLLALAAEHEVDEHLGAFAVGGAAEQADGVGRDRGGGGGSVEDDGPAADVLFLPFRLRAPVEVDAHAGGDLAGGGVDGDFPG